ncbi:LytR C-terminal domain-containing protein [Georgenia thermotolerans]|uniref:LytR family transcriptional regulator n=1 Tax=Georgenia thermotolerans TaxID=527326 RepID=A0A7J5UJB9_9MICO|nr:LytR C-terminal domain-containing protein [Georgenia thermotolerans]KAE8762479.1 LytR family transcriptional regulator [Georgenia thermotolerans]
MTPTATDETARQQALRRRRLQQRQTVIFGALITVLLVVGLVAGLMWAGAVPAPFKRSFSSASPTEQQIVTPCPPEGATPVAFSEVLANVFNGTDRGGLAGETGQALGQLGVVVNQQANWPQGAYTGAVQIVVGPLGVTAGYSLARIFPGAVVSLDSSRGDESVDVVLGEKYDKMLAPDQIAALDPAAPLEAPAGCTPVEAPTQAPA